MASPYTSHGFTFMTSSASPARSSITSSGASRDLSRSAQYSTMASSEVQSRTTTHTGSRCSSRSASRKPAGLSGTPSVAITTTTCCPLCKSVWAAGSISEMILVTAAVSGVVPSGEGESKVSSACRSPSPPAAPTAHAPPLASSDRYCPASLRLSKWKSVLAFKSAESSAMSITVCFNSCHLLHLIILSFLALTGRCPSAIVMDAELSRSQIRSGKARSVSCSSMARLFVKPRAQRIAIWSTEGAIGADCWEHCWGRSVGMVPRLDELASEVMATPWTTG
mmetsp:Transcript_4611/g.9087  ORF Transcript_4611/g.9087 Transcript_4611/m.9087 type:complete len:280 (-) Transcript_4611:292-1131(-)